MTNVHNVESDFKSIFSCETCDNTYHDYGSFRKHTKIEHSVFCIFCDKKFTNEKYLRCHGKLFQFYSLNQYQYLIPIRILMFFWLEKGVGGIFQGFLL